MAWGEDWSETEQCYVSAAFNILCGLEKLKRKFGKSMGI